MANNNYSEEDKQLFIQYEEETGKQAIWRGKVTKAFKEWRYSLFEEEEVEKEITEEVDMTLNEMAEEVDKTIIEMAKAEIERLETLEQQYKDFEAKFNELKKLPIPTEDDFEFKIEKTQAKKIIFYLRVMTTALRKSFARIEILKKKELRRLENQ